MWKRWHLKSPASRLFAQSFVLAQINENIKTPRHLPLWGESTGGFLSQKASKVDSVSIGWHHHGHWHWSDRMMACGCKSKTLLSGVSLTSRTNVALRFGHGKPSHLYKTLGCNDDVIKWKHFPRYRPFVCREFTGCRRIPLTRPVTRSFDVFVDLRLNKRLTIVTLVIWDAIPLIMTSL